MIVYRSLFLSFLVHIMGINLVLFSVEIPTKTMQASKPKIKVISIDKRNRQMSLESEGRDLLPSQLNKVQPMKKELAKVQQGKKKNSLNHHKLKQWVSNPESSLFSTMQNKSLSDQSDTSDTMKTGKGVNNVLEDRQQEPSFSNTGEKLHQDLENQRMLYALKVREVIARSQVYPLLARKTGISGRVILTLTIKSNGEIEGITLKQSSGFEMLDRAAVHSVQNINNLPPPPGGRIEIIVPVVYSFRRGYGCYYSQTLNCEQSTEMETSQGQPVCDGR